MELTLEMNENKWPPPDQVPFLLNQNKIELFAILRLRGESIRYFYFLLTYTLVLLFVLLCVYSFSSEVVLSRTNAGCLTGTPNLG